MGINFTASDATLKHLNIRKEGNEEDAIAAIDLKIECECAAGVLIPLLGADRAPVFWHDNPDQDVLYHGLLEIKCSAYYEDHDLHFCGLDFKGVKLKNFSFTPTPKKNIELVFSASIKSPTNREINVLVEQLHEMSALQVIAPPDLFEHQPDIAHPQLKQPDLLHSNSDLLYPEAVAFVKESGNCTIAHLQRVLKVGYNRAAALIETMESNGIVSVADHAGRRVLL